MHFGNTFTVKNEKSKTNDRLKLRSADINKREGINFLKKSKMKRKI